MVRTILLIVLILLLIGSWPSLGYAPAGWGYYPSGGLGLVLIIVLILAVTGKL
jgi:hypothetical protein